MIDLSEARLVEGPSAISTATTSLRGGLRDAASDLPGDAAQLLPGLAVGDTSRIDANLIDDMRAAGLTHLTAVSGSNVAMIVVVILALATALRVRGRWRFAIGVLAILGFVALVRPDPSVLRAAAMGTIALLPVLLGGRARAAASLCAAVFVLLLLDPWLAVSYGFGLSVFATGGLIVGSSRLTASLRGRLPGGVWPWLIEAAAVTMCAQIAVAPLLAAMGGSLGLASIPANVLAAPAVAPATALGIASALVSAVNPVAAQGIAWVAAAPTEWIAVVAHMCAGIPGGALAIPTGPLGAGIVLAVMGALALIWTARARVRRGSVAAYSQVVARPKTSVTVFAVVLVVGYLVPPGGTGASWPPQGWVMVACDVGQGDAVALRVSDQAAVVVDAGPDPKLVDRCLSDMGITSIPLLVLTHFHADHVEGVPGVLRGRSVGLIEVSPLAEPTDGVRRVSVWAHDAGVPIRTTQVGETGAVGIVGWRVLWPQRLIHGEGSDPNNASVVMLVRLGGLRILLTGDVEPAAQLALRRNLAGDPGLRDLDVVKVPHHGSRHQDPGSAMWWRPRVALISVGAGNDYGHPAQDTIAAYEAEGSSVLRTDHQGDIAIVVDSQGLRAVSRR